MGCHWRFPSRIQLVDEGHALSPLTMIALGDRSVNFMPPLTGPPGKSSCPHALYLGHLVRAQGPAREGTGILLHLLDGAEAGNRNSALAPRP